MAVEPNTLRDTLRFWSSGVTIVTTLADEQAQGFKYAGMTVSAFNSLSLEPPLILLCLAKASITTQYLLDAGVFSVSILSGDQAELGDRFSGRMKLPSRQDRFNGVAVETAVTGAPYLQDALAWLDCRVQTVHDGSTHWIVIGEVVATGHKDDTTPPLVYFNRAYSALTPEREQS